LIPSWHGAAPTGKRLRSPIRVVMVNSTFAMSTKRRKGLISIFFEAMIQ